MLHRLRRLEKIKRNKCLNGILLYCYVIMCLFYDYFLVTNDAVFVPYHHVVLAQIR